MADGASPAESGVICASQGISSHHAGESWPRHFALLPARLCPVMLWTVEESDLTALLEADRSVSAAHCVDALRLGAKVEPVRESTDLDQHIFWLDKHRHALSELNDEAALERFMEFLRDSSTRFGDTDLGWIGGTRRCSPTPTSPWSSTQLKITSHLLPRSSKRVPSTGMTDAPAGRLATSACSGTTRL